MNDSASSGGHCRDPQVEPLRRCRDLAIAGQHVERAVHVPLTRNHLGAHDVSERHSAYQPRIGLRWITGGKRLSGISGAVQTEVNSIITLPPLSPWCNISAAKSICASVVVKGGTNRSTDPEVRRALGTRLFYRATFLSNSSSILGLIRFHRHLTVEPTPGSPVYGRS